MTENRVVQKSVRRTKVELLRVIET